MAWMTKDWTSGQLNALVKKIGGEKVARGILDDIVQFQIVEQKKEKQLLELVKTIKVPAVKRFVASEKFVVNKNIDDVPIAWLGENFRKHFLNKKEENVSEAELKAQKLLEDSVDSPILKKLGGKKKVKIFLANFWEALKQKTENQETGWVFGYILADENDLDTLWAVIASRSSVGLGWNVYAFSVEDPLPWNAGFLVVSR